MAKKREAERSVLDDLYEIAQDLDSVGLIGKPDLARMKALCLEKPPVYSPAKVAAIRRRKARMSQSVFASLLNVSTSTVQKWESSESGKHPSGAAAKLLQLIEKKGVDAVLM